jgi:hypothetical protein
MDNEEIFRAGLASFAEGGKALPLFKDRQIEPLAIAGFELVKILAEKSSESEADETLSVCSSQSGSLERNNGFAGRWNCSRCSSSAVNLHQS